MLLHVGLLVEALAAVGARVGPGVRVDEQVGRERRGALERLAALLALQQEEQTIRPTLDDGFLSLSLSLSPEIDPTANTCHSLFLIPAVSLSFI